MRPITLMFAIQALLTGCTEWQVQQASPAELIATEHPKRVRVTTTAGRAILGTPLIAGDSLVGSSKGSPRIAVALADVTRVEVRHVNSEKTAALVVGWMAAAALTAVVIGPLCDIGETCQQ